MELFNLPMKYLKLLKITFIHWVCLSTFKIPLILVCNFQSMKSPVELNSLFFNSFVISPCFIRHQTGRGNNHNWIKSFLSSRKQYIEIDPTTKNHLGTGEVWSSSRVNIRTPFISFLCQ